MSRFADATATRRVEFGACLCPGTPHDVDYALIRAEASAQETGRFIGAQGLDDVGEIADAISIFIVGWNLLGPDGKDWPPSTEALLSLKLPTLTPLIEAIGAAVDESSRLPNSSGAPSRASSRASASASPKRTRTPGT